MIGLATFGRGQDVLRAGEATVKVADEIGMEGMATRELRCERPVNAHSHQRLRVTQRFTGDHSHARGQVRLSQMASQRPGYTTTTAQGPGGNVGK